MNEQNSQVKFLGTSKFEGIGICLFFDLFFFHWGEQITCMSFLQNYLKAYGAEGRRHLPYKNGSFFDNADDNDDKVSTKYFNTIKVNHLII